MRTKYSYLDFLYNDCCFILKISASTITIFAKGDLNKGSDQ